MLVMPRLRKAGLQFHIEKTLLTVKRHLKVGRNEGEKGERETKKGKMESIFLIRKKCKPEGNRVNL